MMRLRPPGEGDSGSAADAEGETMMDEEEAGSDAGQCIWLR